MSDTAVESCFQNFLLNLYLNKYDRNILISMEKINKVFILWLVFVILSKFCIRILITFSHLQIFILSH